MTALLAQQAALYRSDSNECIAGLIEADDALAAMLQTQRTNPTIGGAERIAFHIAGMQHAANQLTVVLLKEKNG